MTEARLQVEVMLRCLREAVREALERKRLLGHYAVVWKDGKVVRLTGDQLIIPEADEQNPPK